VSANQAACSVVMVMGGSSSSWIQGLLRGRSGPAAVVAAPD
jgi:hypothetical protein